MKSTLQFLPSSATPWDDDNTAFYFYARRATRTLAGMINGDRSQAQWEKRKIGVGMIDMRRTLCNKPNLSSLW